MRLDPDCVEDIPNGGTLLHFVGTSQEIAQITQQREGSR
jgi:hypothetical protein